MIKIINGLKTKLKENRDIILSFLNYTFLTSLSVFIYNIICIVASLYLRDIFSFNVLSIIFFISGVVSFGYLSFKSQNIINNLNYSKKQFKNKYIILIILMMSGFFYYILYFTSVLATKLYIDLNISTISSNMYLFLRHITLILDILKIYVCDLILLCCIFSTIIGVILITNTIKNTNKKRKGDGLMKSNIICLECGAENDYEIKKDTVTLEGEGYCFKMEAKFAFCKKCGEPIYVQEIDDEMVRIAHEKIIELRNKK